MRLVFVLAAVCIALSGCLGHSLPPPGWNNAVLAPGVVQTFVDANGTFYPNNWRANSVIGERDFERADSLLNAVAGDRDITRRNALHAYEERWLQTVAEEVRGSRRVFILIHGFNDAAETARASYEVVRSNLDIRPDDAVIEFYWDGLKTWGGPVGKRLASGRIWFWATGYSQVGGSRGLRRILDRIENADVYLISHSRGASVSLSALSNPTYDPGFSRPTEMFLCPDGNAVPQGSPPCPPGFLSPPRLEDRGNTYHLLMMAPAIGNPDFWDPETAGEYRQISPWPYDIRYTINRQDDVLKKLFGGLSPHFNATDLGYSSAVGEALSRHYQAQGYPAMQGYPISDLKSHSFSLYADCKVTLRMFADAGIAPPRPPEEHNSTTC